MFARRLTVVETAENHNNWIKESENPSHGATIGIFPTCLITFLGHSCLIYEVCVYCERPIRKRQTRFGVAITHEIVRLTRLTRPPLDGVKHVGLWPIGLDGISIISHLAVFCSGGERRKANHATHMPVILRERPQSKHPGSPQCQQNQSPRLSPTAFATFHESIYALRRFVNWRYDS